MKIKFTLLKLFLVLGMYSMNAQLTEVVGDLSTPGKLVKQGDILYFTSIGSANPSNIAYPIAQHNIATGVTESFLLGIETPWPIIFTETEFYVAEFFNGRIFRGEIANPGGTLTQLPLTFSDVSDIYLIENELYVISQSLGNLYKFDVTDENPTSEIVVGGLNSPYDLYLKENDLYIVESFGNRISKIDITDADPTRVTAIDGLNEPDSMVIIGDEAYITEYAIGEVVKVNLTDPDLQIETIVDGLAGPTGIIADGLELYFTETLGNKISKFNLNQTAGVEDVNGLSEIHLFPNPAKNEIQLSGVEDMVGYTIYDALGKKVLLGEVSNLEKITIEKISNGVYFLEINNAYTLRFVKE